MAIQAVSRALRRCMDIFLCIKVISWPHSPPRVRLLAFLFPPHCNEIYFSEYIFSIAWGGDMFVGREKELSGLCKVINTEKYKNIRKLLISSTGILRMYIENVLLREIGKAYDVRILEVIGNGKKRYSDIQSVVARNDNGSLSKQMNNLMDMETITKVFPINRPDDKKKVFL